MTKCKAKGCKRKCGTCRFYAIVIAIIIIACAVIYIADYYHADEASIAVYTDEIDNDITSEDQIEITAEEIIKWISTKQ